MTSVRILRKQTLTVLGVDVEGLWGIILTRVRNAELASKEVKLGCDCHGNPSRSQ